MGTEKKYKLTDEFVTMGYRKLYRIEALKDFSNVKKGDKGGFVESENNLSQKGNCWIHNDAKVYGDAVIADNAKVYGYAWVFENAEIYGNAKVYENVEIYGNAKVWNNSMIYGKAKIYGDANIFGNAKVKENAEVYGNANVCGNVLIYGEAKIYGDAKIFGEAEVKSNATILSNSDYIVFKNWWSSGRYFTWTRSNNMWKVGCFYGTGEELIAKAYKDSELSGREYEKVVKYVESILKDSK